jgi:hypothetical protein
MGGRKSGANPSFFAFSTGSPVAEGGRFFKFTCGEQSGTLEESHTPNRDVRFPYELRVS